MLTTNYGDEDFVVIGREDFHSAIQPYSPIFSQNHPIRPNFLMKNF